MRRSRSALLVGVFVLSGGCFLDSSTAPDPRAVVRVFVRNIVDVMEANSVRRDSIDWVAFRTDVMAELQGATTYDQSYPAIKLALERLGDNHSWFQLPSGFYLPYTRAFSCVTASVPTPTDIPADIGYVRVPSFSGTAAEGQLYMQAIQQMIADHDSESVVGWIVDLRGNGGGNMWPMLASLSPFLEGMVGMFVDPDSVWQRWDVHDGVSFLDQYPLAGIDPVYSPRAVDGRLAVLTDVRVASSGEAVAVAFRGRANTRAFGTGTCGVSTGIVAGAVADGYILGLATVAMADRDSMIYGGAVAPDEHITDPAAVLTRAIEWIRTGM